MRYVFLGFSMCDTVIEEHFRRSLGQDYNAIFSNANNTTDKEKEPTPRSSPTVRTVYYSCFFTLL